MLPLMVLKYPIRRTTFFSSTLEDRTRPAVEVVCTHCGETFYAEKVDAGGCSACYAPAPFGWYHQEMSESVYTSLNVFRCAHL